MYYYYHLVETTRFSDRFKPICEVLSRHSSVSKFIHSRKRFCSITFNLTTHSTCMDCSYWRGNSKKYYIVQGFMAPPHDA